MKKTILALTLVMALSACKKEQKQEAAAPPPAPTVETLAQGAVAATGDWTENLDAYLDTILTCANASPVQTKYVFRADRFEQPAVTLILLKLEDDRIYACSVDRDQTVPHYKEVRVKPDPKAPRFYPGALPKPDSCLNNAVIKGKNGQNAGWLSRVTC